MSYISEEAILELENRIRSKEFKINSLLDITTAINSNKSVAEILNIYNYILSEQLGIRKFILFNHQYSWQILDKMGIKGKAKDIDVEADFLKFTEITVIESSHKKSLDKFDVVIPVYHKDTPLAFLVLGGIKDQLLSKDQRSFINLNFIQTLTNIIVVAIENKRMATESIKQESVKKELEIASEMQRLLFPAELPTNLKIDISAKYLSHSQVSGDYYDYIQLNDDELKYGNGNEQRNE